MLSKHLPVSLAFLLLLFVFCLRSYGEDARQSSGTLVTITPEPTDEIAETVTAQAISWGPGSNALA
jgi:hypothetical protein